MTDDDFGRVLTCFEQSDLIKPEETLRIKKHVASTNWFNGLSTSMVCINAVFVGIQADNTHSDLVADNIGFFVVDCFFFIFFMSETYIRITQHRWEYFFESWNLFDYFVIALTFVRHCLCGCHWSDRWIQVSLGRQNPSMCTYHPVYTRNEGFSKPLDDD